MPEELTRPRTQPCQTSHEIQLIRYENVNTYWSEATLPSALLSGSTASCTRCIKLPEFDSCERTESLAEEMLNRRNSFPRLDGDELNESMFGETVIGMGAGRSEDMATRDWGCDLDTTRRSTLVLEALESRRLRWNLFSRLPITCLAFSRLPRRESEEPELRESGGDDSWLDTEGHC